MATFYKWSTLRGYRSFSVDVKPFDSDWNVYLILIISVILWKRFGEKEKVLYFGILLSSVFLSLLSGTRTLVLVYAYILILGLFFVRKMIFQIFTFSLSLVAVTYFSFPTLPDSLQRRYLDWTSQFRTLGFSQYIYGFDASTNLRFLQREYYKSIWLENVFFGTGIGQSSAEANRVADTPYAFLAQFGLLGAFTLVLVLSYILLSTVSRVKESSIESAQILILYLMCLAPITIAYNWTLHKSFWLSLSCLLGYVLHNENKPIKLSPRAKINLGIDVH